MDNPDHPPHNDTVTRPPNSVGLTSWDGGSDIFQHPTTFFGPFNGDNQILSNLENSLVGRERNGEDYDAAVDDAHYYGAALPLPLPVLDTPTNATRSTQPSALVEYVTTTTTLITAMATQVQQGVAAGGHEAERETEGIVTLVSTYTSQIFIHPVCLLVSYFPFIIRILFGITSLDIVVW
ncbi:hypothetical protein FS842_004251 [Serendipita sp. 407]|nr:hypothetical protein FS842_004251 [Serendipita sp. 407]